MKTNSIKKKLNEFIETATFDDYKFPEDQRLQISEGCQFILDRCATAWIFDTILLFQLNRKELKLPLQVWIFNKLPDGRMKLSCENDKGEYLFGRNLATILCPYDEMKFMVNDRYVAIYDEVYDEPE